MTGLSKMSQRFRFEYESYMNWAYEEAYDYIRKHSEKSPLNAIEEFRWNMDMFACCAKTPQANFIFSVAYDVATDVLDKLLKREGYKHVRV